MAHYRASIETRRPRAEVFAYLSDFSTTQEWDPGTARAERVGDEPVAKGTEFRLLASFMGRTAPITYRIEEYDAPNMVYLVGENATVISRDRMTFEEVDGGTRVTYDARLTLKGALRVADPLLSLAFRRVGDRALAGLRRRLTTSLPQTMVPVGGRSLDGRSYRLPYDLPTPYGMLVIAFRREQQQLVEDWLPALLELERTHHELGVYELPVISSRYSPARRVIERGMAHDIVEAPARARTIAVYTDVGRVLGNVGLQGSDAIVLLLVERSGTILAREFGSFSEQKLQRLADALPVFSPAE